MDSSSFGNGYAWLIDYLCFCNNSGTDAQHGSIGRNNIRKRKGINYKGSRLVLKNRIELQIGFKGIDKSCRAVYTYTNHYGDEKTVEVEGEDFISVSGLLGVSISQPVVADCRNVITVTVYDANGETVGYAEDSVESYVNRMGEGGDLFEAIMKFSDSSYAALH